MPDKKPFNDATDHMNRIEGSPLNTDQGKGSLPKPIRWIGIFIIGAFVLGALFILIGSFMN
ncbi:hypothetical protein Q0N12_11400 [Rossellomorea marisflavi]|uniref:hypothetical protein n=1 Tax=Rossellomorea marisflavi TaxID=189381 RepID=UPI00345938FA